MGIVGQAEDCNNKPLEPATRMIVPHLSRLSGYAKVLRSESRVPTGSLSGQVNTA